MKNLVELSCISNNYFNSTQGFKLINLKVFLDFLVTVITGVVCLRMESKLTQMIKGLAVIFFVKTVAEVTNLCVFTSIMEMVKNCGPILGAVVFQPEIRSTLQLLGRIIRFKKRRNVNAQLLLSVETALRYLSKRKIGALLTIERLMNLQDFIDTGIPLNAEVTGELLKNIFIPNTPLHDGAVIIRNGKIAAASTYLPASLRTLPTKFGTRHRAALGISEVSDSITIVVSEESGQISVAFDSTLATNLTVENCLQVVKCEMSWM